MDNTQTGLKIAEGIFNIIGSLSIVVALFAYLYRKNRDNVEATIDQITFFRKEIISYWTEVQEVIKKKKPGLGFSRISLEQPFIDFIRNEFSYNFANQSSLFLDTSSENITTWVDTGVLGKQIELFNLLEEFSLRVRHLGTQDNPALQSVHNPFVEIIEMNAAALLFVRDVVLGDSDSFSTLLWLYNSWKAKSIKTNSIVNLAKHGFITQEKKKEILDQQRARTKNSKSA
ncbi:MAG: hypothetical protein KBD16_03160 [Candidatus Pacebacteria bacterium]|nr:hypothetical protein [Candidatus Paceibacterota bacterium]